MRILSTINRNKGGDDMAGKYDHLDKIIAKSDSENGRWDAIGNINLRNEKVTPQQKALQDYMGHEAYLESANGEYDNYTEGDD